MTRSPEFPTPPFKNFDGNDPAPVRFDKHYRAWRLVAQERIISLTPPQLPPETTSPFPNPR